jgi:hypothetical protein
VLDLKRVATIMTVPLKAINLSEIDSEDAKQVGRDRSDEPRTIGSSGVGG